MTVETNTLQNAVDAMNNVTDSTEQLRQTFQQQQDTIEHNNKSMLDWQTATGNVAFKDKVGNTHHIPAFKTLVEGVQSITPHPAAMTKAQFDALREIRKQQYAGSGFVEWGRHNTSIYHKKVNEGMWQWVDSTFPNRFIMGEAKSNRNTGASKSIYPKLHIDGAMHHVLSVNSSRTQVVIEFPPAPDGTKTYDSTTGTVTQHNNAEVAFASETDTNKVITSRKDLVFLESWHEKIADKDVVYPYGNVQFGVKNYSGVALLNNLVAQGYSAFGEWDQNTKGYAVKWSTLTDEQKAIFLSEPEHNIYYDPEAKAYIQVRYRIRVIEGHGDNWESVNEITLGKALIYSHNPIQAINPRGQLSLSSDYKNNYSSGCFHDAMRDDAGSNQAKDVGVWTVNNIHEKYAHNAKCHAIPIALVQRLNQGAYHPSYNPMGTAQYTMLGVSNYHWHQLPTSLLMSTLGCFILPTETSIGRHPEMGYVSGHGYSRADQYKYYDVIYSGQVEDLRLNANKLDVNQLREDTMRKAIAGALRGKGRCLFTHFKTLNSGYFAVSNQFNAAFKDAASGEKKTLDFYGNGLPEGTSIMVWQPSNGVTLYGKVTANGHAALTDKPENLSASAHINPARLGLSMADICYFAEVKELSSEFESLPWVDIIGHPDRIAATFPDGVVGKWVPHMIDNTQIHNVLLNRKSNVSVGNQVYTHDNGQVWTSNTFAIDMVENTRKLAANEQNIVIIQHYESLSHFTEPSNNSVVVGDVDDVYYTTHHNPVEGNRLQGSLTGGIGKATTDPAQAFAPNLGGYKTVNGQFSENSKYPVKTGEVPLAPQGNNSPAVKALPTITEKNGLYYLQLHGAQIQYDQKPIIGISESSTDPKLGYQVSRVTDGPLRGRLLKRMFDTATPEPFNSPYWSIDTVGLKFHGNTVYSFKFFTDSFNWGDDQTIPIVDGENTKTDLNGNTVKVFCHHSQFPIGIAHND